MLKQKQLGSKNKSYDIFERQNISRSQSNQWKNSILTSNNVFRFFYNVLDEEHNVKREINVANHFEFQESNEAYVRLDQGSQTRGPPDVVVRPASS